MPINVMPNWFANLDDEDVSFIKKFLLVSGSLKEIAKLYGVTYPTVRLRLDKLIQKIQMSDEPESDSFVTLVRQLTVNGKISIDTAKVLISEHQKTKGEEQ